MMIPTIKEVNYNKQLNTVTIISNLAVTIIPLENMLDIRITKKEVIIEIVGDGSRIFFASGSVMTRMRVVAMVLSVQLSTRKTYKDQFTPAIKGQMFGDTEWLN